MVLQPTAPHLGEIAEMVTFEGCWYCGDDIRGARVFWHGVDGLWLHPRCAQDLGARLMRDAYELIGAPPLREATP